MAGPAPYLPPVGPARRRPGRLLVRGAVLCALAGLAVALLYFCLSLRHDLSTIRQMPERTVVFDAFGRELGTLHGESRRLIERDEIPDFLVAALLAREDKRFPGHHGVDLLGLGRAALRNARDRSFTQGASTITMQLARNSLDLGDHDLHRKALEIALAFRLESRFSKDEILTAYLNRIYFGSGCHGIGEAARHYFAVPAAELNPNQCALLAGIIRGPHAFDPLRNLDGALAQRDEVLARMITEDDITPERAGLIRQLPLDLARDAAGRDDRTALQAIRRHLEALLGKEDIRRGGLHLHTTLDVTLQSRLETELAAAAQRCAPDTQVAGVCLDTATGAIRAIVGGRQAAPTTFNRALDARRDVGPVIGPFLSAAAAERQLPIHEDQPVRTGRAIGHRDLVRLLRRIGFGGPFADGDDLYRGSLGATPLEMATAAATLANGGNRPRTFLLDEIRDSGGTLLFRSSPSLTGAIGNAAAETALGSAFPADDPGQRRPRFLTGHSPGRSNAWGISLGTRHATCVWVGHDQPRPLHSPERATEVLHTVLAALGPGP
jgi:penicillin-binding protein 1A